MYLFIIKKEAKYFTSFATFSLLHFVVKEPIFMTVSIYFPLLYFLVIPTPSTPSFAPNFAPNLCLTHVFFFLQGKKTPIRIFFRQAFPVPKIKSKILPKKTNETANLG